MDRKITKSKNQARRSTVTPGDEPTQAQLEKPRRSFSDKLLRRNKSPSRAPSSNTLMVPGMEEGRSRSGSFKKKLKDKFRKHSSGAVLDKGSSRGSTTSTDYIST